MNHVWKSSFFVALIGAGFWRLAEPLHARRKKMDDQPTPQIPSEAIRNTITNTGLSIEALSQEAPVLLIFLRHLGCTFCRETLSDIREKRDYLTRKKIQPVFVHLSPEEKAAPIFEKYSLGDVPRISDPGKALYHAFGLQRGRILQLLGPRVWWRGFVVAILNRHGFGRLMGDGLQMPGVFLIYKGKVLKDFRHRTTGDRPDYEGMAEYESTH
ncbi:MAG: hypothetical protein DIKNOCCD_03253 [bacterium]|nr:hypothetical protein [bacterium]MCE7908586.1 AhpC/TSA family protein [Candidatus Omnitrophica bacterium COP1]